MCNYRSGSGTDVVTVYRRMTVMRFGMMRLNVIRMICNQIIYSRLICVCVCVCEQHLEREAKQLPIYFMLKCKFCFQYSQTETVYFE